MLNFKSVYLLSFLVFLGCKSATEKADENRGKPNVVIFFADDLGYADVGFHGCTEIPTPNIDAIAASGIVFSNGYVTASVCSPTRCGLLSGKYQQRLGCENVIAGYKLTEESVCGLPLEQKTMADKLKELGYATACFGKWHLGGEQGDTNLFPQRRGFDEFFGFLEGAALYIDPENKEKKYMRGYEILSKEPRYFTDAITEESISFIDRNADHPFFLYLPFSAVHAPLEATEEYMKPFKHIENPNRRTMCAMLYAMDINIGKVMSHIREKGLEENTLIYFLSDNGGKPYNNYSLNHPLRGEKNQYYEGGIHIPFCMTWKGHLPENKTYDHPVSSLDIYPTTLAAIGEEIHDDLGLEGVNLLPFIQGQDLSAPHDFLYWKQGGKFAIRNSDWKLVKEGTEMELFNISKDPYETENLIAEQSEMAEILLEQYKRWDKDNIPAQYGHDKRIFKIKVERTRRLDVNP